MSFEWLEFAKLGEESFKQNKYEDAINYYNKAIELSPQTASFYNQRGDAYRKLYMHDKAINDYTKAIELGELEAYNGRGLIKYCLKDYKGAIEDYSEFLNLAGECYVYDNRGDAKKQLKDNKGAIEDYKEAIDDYLAYNAYEDVIKTCKKIIDLNPNESEIYNIMSNAAGRLGETQQNSNFNK